MKNERFNKVFYKGVQTLNSKLNVVDECIVNQISCSCREKLDVQSDYFRELASVRIEIMQELMRNTP